MNYTSKARGETNISYHNDWPEDGGKTGQEIKHK